MEQYNEALTSFAEPVNAPTTYDPEIPDNPAEGNDPRFFACFDATEQASFLCSSLERTVEKDFEEEINIASGFEPQLPACTLRVVIPDSEHASVL
jgi:hypothetical protein